MPLLRLPDSPSNSREDGEWIVVASGVVEDTAKKYHNLADCLEAHRDQGVIR